MTIYYSTTEKQAYIVEIEEAQLAMSPEASGSSCDEADVELLSDHGVSSSAQLPMGPSPGVMVTDASRLLKQASEQQVEMDRVATIHTELNNPVVTYNHCNEAYNMPTAVMATTNSMTSPQNLIGTYTPPQPLLPMLQDPQQLLPMMYQPPQLAEQHQPLPPQLRQQFPPSIGGYPTIPGFPPVSNFLQPHPPRMPTAHNISGTGMFRMQ